jgi:hypothetical protein
LELRSFSFVRNLFFSRPGERVIDLVDLTLLWIVNVLFVTEEVDGFAS